MADVERLLVNFRNEYHRMALKHNSSVLVEFREINGFFVLIEHPNTPENPNSFPVARIDVRTLEVYSPHGKVARGTLHNQYGGFDLINWRGVIVNNQSALKRRMELMSV